MTYFKLNTILACSVSICLAATGPSQGSGPTHDKKNGEKETVHPRTESPARQGIPEKIPMPPPEDPIPARDDPPESPAGADDKKDCDECVLVSVPTGGAAAGSNTIGQPASRGVLPYGLASTLWGLFFVGRPRLFPKARIRGMTAP